MNDFIYLDNNSTTPLDPRVLEAMMPFMTDLYANASSIHKFGQRSKEAVQLAREQVANLIGSQPREIIFTSGATEGINLAVKGLLEQIEGNNKKHIVTVATEHKAMLDVFEYMERKGYEVDYLPVKPDGLLDLEIVENTIRPDTAMVSVMYVNNETGVIQPIKEIARIAHSKGAYFMSDATQAVGKIPVDVVDLDVDLMPFSAHKFYGPKGIGALYVRSRRPNRIKLEAIIHGGGHERGYRSGTLNTYGIVGLGKAAELARKEMKSNEARIRLLRDDLETKLLEIPGSFINGSRENRLYNVINICFPGVDSEALMMGLDNIIVSNGSACTSTSIEPSHVLIAMGRNQSDAFSSLRISFGKDTRGLGKNELGKGIKVLCRQLSTLKST